MPYGIFAQGMGIAILPSLSSDIAIGKTEEYKNTLMRGIKVVLLLTIPSGVGFMVLKEPIIRTIFKMTSLFSEESVLVAGNILMFFSIALLSQSIVTIINRAFYALNDTLTPLLVGGTTIIINILLSFIFYKTTNMGVSGMALSYSLASALNAIFLLLILNKKMKGIYLKQLMGFLVKILPASLIMGGILFLMDTFITVDSQAKIVEVISLGSKIGVGVMVYFAAVLLIGVEEANYVKNIFVSKLRDIKNKRI